MRENCCVGKMPVLNRQDFADSQFVRDIERSAIDEFNRENPYEQTFYNDVAGFVAAVNWKEDGHWLAVLFGIQLMYFLLVVCFRRVEIIQLGVFVTICGLILASEYVNQFLHDHWREFSTQDYFDEHGVFFSVVFSGPLLAIGFLQASCPDVAFALLFYIDTTLTLCFDGYSLSWYSVTLRIC